MPGVNFYRIHYDFEVLTLGEFEWLKIFQAFGQYFTHFNIVDNVQITSNYIACILTSRRNTDLYFSEKFKFSTFSVSCLPENL